MSDTSNLFDEGGAQAPPATLEHLRDLGNQFIQSQAVVDELEDALALAKRHLNEMKTKTLPEAMKSVQMSEFALDDGTKISISAFVSGTLPKDAERREAAFVWLRDNEGDSLIKTSVELSFGRGQENIARDTIEDLIQRGLEPAVDKTVHPQTLASFARERLANGDPIDLEVLGLFCGHTAKVTAPKVKKR